MCVLPAIPAVTMEEQSLSINWKNICLLYTSQNLEIAMAGAHQVKNAIAALATLSILRDHGDILITKEQIYAGFKAAKQPGRLEVLSMGQEQPMLVIDGHFIYCANLFFYYGFQGKNK